VYPSAPALEQIPDARANPSEIAHCRDTVKRVCQQLPDDWRILWSRAEGRSRQEIAGEGGRTSDAVRIHYSRLIASLKTRLAC
jgi:hypothetical protein